MHRIHFEENANSIEKLYNEQYANQGGCTNLPQPAFYICLDLSIHHGPAWTLNIIKNNPIGDMNGKEYGHLINEFSRQLYYQMSKQSSAFNSRINDFISIVDARKEYINNYC